MFLMQLTATADSLIRAGRGCLNVPILSLQLIGRAINDEAHVIEP
jgi:hypothetical protein